MEVLVIGLNHKTAPIELREKLSVPGHKAADVLRTLESRGIFDERLLLSTCNRTELYGVSAKPHQAIQKAKEFLSEYSSLNLQNFEKNLYVLSQPDSVEHLFSVASGLDSMVLGETEIIGQVKESYLAAHEGHQTGKVLNNLFQRSLKVAKSVRTHTAIGAKKVSVASIAVDLAEKILGDLKSIKVMVIGTGEMSTQVARAMTSKGAAPIIASSKHFGRAQELAQALGGEALEFEDRHNRIFEVDVLIAATEAPCQLVSRADVESWMPKRHHRPLFLIDIAMPRNIDASVEKADNVYLYNLDDLKKIADANTAFRESQLEHCSGLVHAQAQHFMRWLGKEFGLAG